MKSSDRDDLLVRQVQAAEALADAAGRTISLQEAQERRLSARERSAVHRPPRRIFAGESGLALLLRAIPGFAHQFAQSVPDTHVAEVPGRDGSENRVVICPCGAMTSLPVDEVRLTECSGEPSGCLRWFLGLRTGVRVRRYEPELEEAAA